MGPFREHEVFRMLESEARQGSRGGPQGPVQCAPLQEAVARDHRFFFTQGGGVGGCWLEGKSVLGCIEADFCNPIFMVQYLSRCTRFAYVCTVPNLSVQ